MEPHNGFNDLDYIVIGIVLLSGLLALMRGFVREVLSLLAWGGAFAAAVKFYPLAIPTLHHYIKSDTAAQWAAGACVFFVTLVVLLILSSLICGLIKGRALTSIDRSLGFAFGLARGVLVVCLVYLGAVMMFWPDIDMPPEQQQQDKDRNVPPDLLLEAKTRPALAYGANILKVFVPKKMIDDKLRNAEKNLEENKKAGEQQMLDTLSTPAPPGQNRPADATTSPTISQEAPQVKKP